MSAGWKRPLVLASACWAAFVVVLVVAYSVPLALWADGWSVDGFLNLQEPWLKSLATNVASLADPLPFAVWTFALAGVALYRRRPRRALAVVVLLFGANAVTEGLKELLQHERWHAFLGHAQLSATAFPSGHATASMSLAYGAVLVAPAAWRPVVAAVGALFALAVSESVMLLAWHFPSDVLGGFLVATACALTTLAALRASEQRWPERTGRDAARRAIGAVDLRRAAVLALAFVAAVLMVGAAAAGGRSLTFADRHTTAVLAAVVVAALAGVLPLTLVALGARRS